MKTPTNKTHPLKHPDQRVGVFIDVQNMYYSAKNLFHMKVNFGNTVDAIRLSPSLDTIILVSGDGDYLPLVEYLQNQGKQVEVMAFGNTSSSKLREEADDFIDLGGEEKNKFLIADRPVVQSRPTNTTTKAYPPKPYVQKTFTPKVYNPKFKK